MSRQRTGIPPKNRLAPVMDDLKELSSMPSKGSDRICDLERMAMLHGIDCGMSVDRIAGIWRISKSSVQRFKRGLYGKPLSVFELRVIQRAGNGLFQCRLCGEPRGKLKEARRHVLGHFLAPEYAQNIDLSSLPQF